MLIYRIVICVITFVAMILFGYGALTNMNTEKDRAFARLCVLGTMLSAMACGMCLSVLTLHSYENSYDTVDTVSKPNIYIYEKDGITKEFSIMDLPDSSWTFVNEK